MTPEYFQQKARYNNKKDDNVTVSKGFQDFIDRLPKTYEPKDIRIGSKVIMTHGERVKYLHNSELGRLYRFKQDVSVQGTN
jgi:hypothetical protein